LTRQLALLVAWLAFRPKTVTKAVNIEDNAWPAGKAYRSSGPFGGVPGVHAMTVVASFKQVKELQIDECPDMHFARPPGIPLQ